MKCCECKEKRYERVKAMNHEERLKYAQEMKHAGYGMIGGGISVFGGMVGGLWPSIGAGAIGAACGASFGLIFGSRGPFHHSKEILEWDKELEAASSNPDIAAKVDEDIEVETTDVEAIKEVEEPDV